MTVTAYLLDGSDNVPIAKPLDPRIGSKGQSSVMPEVKEVYQSSLHTDQKLRMAEEAHENHLRLLNDQEDSISYLRRSNKVLMCLVVLLAVGMPVATWFAISGKAGPDLTPANIEQVMSKLAAVNQSVAALDQRVTANTQTAADLDQRVSTNTNTAASLDQLVTANTKAAAAAKASLSALDQSLNTEKQRVNSIESKMRDGICSFCVSCGGKWPVFVGDFALYVKDTKRHGSECAGGFQTSEGMRKTVLCCATDSR